MNKTRKARVLSMTQWALAAATLLVAALLIVQCARIYRAGMAAENLSDAGVQLQNMYSREIVAARFKEIAWSVALWTAAFVAALGASLLWHGDGKVSLSITPENRLELFKLHACSTPEMLAEEKKRRNFALICGAVCIGCGGMVAAYILNPANFASWDLEPIIGALMLHTAPYILLAFAALMGLAYIGQKSILREIQAAKNAPKHATQPIKATSTALLTAVRLSILVAAIALLAVGVRNGGMRDVLVKAINICTECIGLG